MLIVACPSFIGILICFIHDVKTCTIICPVAVVKHDQLICLERILEYGPQQ